VRRLRITVTLTAVAVAIAPEPAYAHLMNTGFGPFYDGLLHLLLTPENVLPVIAMALFAGRRGPRDGRAVLFALPLAWLAGSVAGLVLAPGLALPVVTAAVTIALGVMLALNAPVSPATVLAMAVSLGVVNGVLNGSELAAVRGSVLTALGTVVAIFATVSLLAARAASLRSEWARIAVRVAGSWIGAVGLLMLGWTMRGV
jgi:urease accessory protein